MLKKYIVEKFPNLFLLLKKIKFLTYRSIFIAFRIFPINSKKVVIDNFNGLGFGDNPKYIVEDLMLKTDLKFYWLTKNDSEIIPEGIKKIKVNSIKSFFHLVTAKIWIDNVRKKRYVLKRKNQVYLQTWHGSFSAKKIEKDVEDKLSNEYISDAKNDSDMLDGVLVNSKIQETLFIDCFWLKSKKYILPFGLPRNDFLVNNSDNDQIKDKIRKRYNLKRKKNVILYAPTFRDDLSTSGYLDDFSKILVAFKSKFHNDFYILVKMHPNVIKQNIAFFDEKKSNIVNVSDYEDIQELYCLADFLISDYSSVPFDFSILKKPVFLFTQDEDEYDKKRGLLPQFTSFPFIRVKSIDEFVRAINEFSYSKYSKGLSEFFEKYPVYDDGRATNRVNEWLSNIARFEYIKNKI